MKWNKISYVSGLCLAVLFLNLSACDVTNSGAGDTLNFDQPCEQERLVIESDTLKNVTVTNNIPCDPDRLFEEPDFYPERDDS